MRPDGALDRVRVHLDAAVVEECNQPGPMANGVAHGLCQIGRAGDTVNVNAQPVVQLLDEPSTSVLSDTLSLLGGSAANLRLDRIEGGDTLQDLGRERRFR
jgi:hypothetical protein